MHETHRQVSLLARREIRQGKLTFVLSLLTNMLAAAMLATVLGLGDSMRSTLSRDARTILGGDFELRMNTRGFSEEELGYVIANSDQHSRVTVVRALSFAGDLQAFVQLRAVDDKYPLLGSVGMVEGAFDHALLETPVTDGIAGFISQDLAGALDIGIGERLEIGAAEIEVVGLVNTIPDPSATMMLNAPVVFIARDNLSATGLDQHGSLRSERLRILIGARDAVIWRDQLDAAFPDDEWRVRGTDRVVPNLQELIARMETLLLLVSLGTMLIAGICVGNTVSTYLRSRIVSIAILRSLGMSAVRIRLSYWLVSMLFVVAGALLGLIPGYIAQNAILQFLSGQLPFVVEPVISWRTLLLIPTIAILVGWIFAVRPLHTFSQISPTSLFSLTAGTSVVSEKIPSGIGQAMLIPGILLAVLLVLASGDQLFLLAFCAGGALATYAFRILATGFIALLAKAKTQLATLKIALRSVIRSGDQVIAASVSLGIGLTALLTFSLTEASFNHQLQANIAQKSPDFYLIGLQPGDPEKVRAATQEWLTSAESFRTLPLQRIEITHIQGVDVDSMEISEDSDWIISGWTTWVSDQNTQWYGQAEVSHGSPWTAENTQQLVSMEYESALDLGLEIGDELTINILGQAYNVNIGNIRRIDWSTMDVNFGLVLSDGPWAQQEHAYLGSTRDIVGDEFAYQRKVVEVAPSVTPIRTKTIVASVTGMLSKIGILLQLVTVTASISGILVLAAAIAEGRHRRAHESVVLRILGMPREMLKAVFRTEFILIATLSVIPSMLIAVLASFSVTTFLLELPWTIDWVTAMIVLGGTLAMVLFLGSLSMRQLLKTPPLNLLRNN